MKVLIVLLVGLVCVQGSFWNLFFGNDEEPLETTNPEFCKDNECPQYTVLEKFHDLSYEFELRRYKPTSWVYTKVPGMEAEYWDDRRWQRETFMKLFDYIRGANDQNMTINMTVPVLKEHHSDTVYMCFMVPEELYGDVPSPTDPDLIIVDVAQVDMYVSSFGGFTYTMFGYNRFKAQNLELYINMMDNGLHFDRSMFYTAIYDSPWTLFNRHNEVWYRKEQMPDHIRPE